MMRSPLSETMFTKVGLCMPKKQKTVEEETSIEDGAVQREEVTKEEDVGIKAKPDLERRSENRSVEIKSPVMSQPQSAMVQPSARDHSKELAVRRRKPLTGRPKGSLATSTRILRSPEH